MMKCVLKCVKRKYPDIPLDNGLSKIIGRCSEYKIKNSRCSRKQVELIPNFSSKTIKVKQLGPNDSGVNGEIIGLGMDDVAKDGDTLNVLVDEINFRVHFEESEEGNESSKERPAKIPKMFVSNRGNDLKNSGNSTLDGNGTWESVGKNELVVYVYGNKIKEPRPCVAAFDMDGTLITTKSGKVFPKDVNDWKFLLPQTVSRLQTFFETSEDYKFVIFTNQAGCKTPADLESMEKKIQSITKQLAIPILVFIAPLKNKYRKPLDGGWSVFVKDYNGGVEPDLTKSFYCGDAAEEFFQNGRPQQDFNMPAFNPKKFVENHPNNDHIQYCHRQEMIIMVGYPGSGKSSFVKSTLLPKGYVHVNRDTLKTAAKCLQVTENSLQNGESVVVDNTNPEKKDRAEYIKLAKKHGVSVRCFRMNVDHPHALHNNKFRELTNEASVPAVAFNTFKSRYQEPALDEGYSEITPVNFVPNFEKFPEAEREIRVKLYNKFLLEK